jgi:hypothetical protein
VKFGIGAGRRSVGFARTRGGAIGTCCLPPLDRRRQRAQRERARHPSPHGSARGRVVAERRVRRHDIGRGLEHVPLSRRALELRLGVDHAGRGPGEAGHREPHARELVAGHRRGRRDRDDRRRRRQRRHALERGAVGRAGDEHGAQHAAAAQVLVGPAQEAQRGALARLLGMGHQEDRIQHEQGGDELGVGIRGDRLAADRRHAAQDPRGQREAAGEWQQARRERVRGRRVREVEHRRDRTDQQVLVLDANTRQAEPDQVDHVRDHGLARQDARASAEERCALGRQVLRLFDPRGPVVASNAACQHASRPSLGQPVILAPHSGKSVQKQEHFPVLDGTRSLDRGDKPNIHNELSQMRRRSRAWYCPCH